MKRPKNSQQHPVDWEMLRPFLPKPQPHIELPPNEWELPESPRYGEKEKRPC